MADKPDFQPAAPGYYIQQELNERQWTTADLALRMGGKTIREVALDKLTVDMLIAVSSKNLAIGDETAGKLARAFNVSKEFFINLDRAWRGVAK